MTIEEIQEVEKEVQRFLKKLNDAKMRWATDQWYSSGCRETGALRRAALDLKNELTKLT